MERGLAGRLADVPPDARKREQQPLAWGPRRAVGADRPIERPPGWASFVLPLGQETGRGARSSALPAPPRGQARGRVTRRMASLWSERSGRVAGTQAPQRARST